MTDRPQFAEFALAVRRLEQPTSSQPEPAKCELQSLLSGGVVETRDYDPFGADISHTGTFSTQHRFTGQPADDQAGSLYNYGARFYNAKWGRFISPDEMVQGFDSQGLNPYADVLNAPTNNIDPTGHMIINGWSFGAWSISTIENNPDDIDTQGRGPDGGNVVTVSYAEATQPGISGNNEMVRAGESALQGEIDAELGKTGSAQANSDAAGVRRVSLNTPGGRGGGKEYTAPTHFNVNLIEHEIAGGKTIEFHVAKEIGYLINRLRQNPDLPAASSFFSLQSATGLINKSLNFGSDKITAWMRSPSRRDLDIYATFDRPTGYSRSGDNKRIRMVNSVIIVLRKGAMTKEGFLIYNSYPTR
jgi:RHS repeat-associated protein